MKEGSSDHATSIGPQRDSKLELFGFDSLVNILGLKRYDPSFYNFI
jgi:potassium/chloride transporter 4/5/6